MDERHAGVLLFHQLGDHLVRGFAVRGVVRQIEVLKQFRDAASERLASTADGAIIGCCRGVEVAASSSWSASSSASQSQSASGKKRSL